jgi:hypothetical protein
MAKHEETFIDVEKGYEHNVIGLRGIIYFAGGLFFLVVLTFGLMWVLQNLMEKQAIVEKDVSSPMMMSDTERLPPEPRLQAAPGFGVDSDRGRVNLELKAPQSEYRNLQEQWETMWRDGQKDAKTGMVATLPMEEAKRRFLEQSAAKPEPNAQQKEEVMKNSRALVSLSSSGRTASDVRR